MTFAWSARTGESKPPQPGVPQTSLYLKHLAHRPGKASLLADMMRQVVNQVRPECRHQYIWRAVYETDPLLGVFDGTQMATTRWGQYCTPGNTGSSQTVEAIRARPCCADF